MLFCCVCKMLWAHDVTQAIYKFEEQNGQLLVTITMDKDDLIAAINQEGHCNATTALGVCANLYVQAHFVCKINRQDLSLNFLAVETTKDWAHLTFKIPTSVKSIQSIKIENSCLLNFKANYTNVVRFVFGKEYKSYQMDKNRQQITARFGE